MQISTCVEPKTSEVESGAVKEPLGRLRSGATTGEGAPAARGLSLVAAFRVFLAAALVFSSAGAIFAVRQSLDTARQLGERAMERTGLALATSAESALRAGKSGGEVREILSDRVVAYALVADAQGTIRFHTNPDLVGMRLPPVGPEAWVPSRRPAGREITLGLGTPAYQYDYPIRAPDGSPEVLRIVLHLGTVDRLGAQARRLWAVVGGVLVLLAAAGLGLDRMLTRLLALRDAMDRRERLSLIGQMTATLAHEIRNALWGVKGYAQWLDEKLPEASPCKSDAAAILHGTDRIEGLVDDLLLYAREETYQLEAVRVAPLVEAVCSEVVSGWSGTVELHVGDGLRAMADRDKLHRAMVNGVRNSLDAMGAGGTLTITAGDAAGEVWVRVEDTGGGIAPEASGRLFTPFYTTKADGTGLGLAYSRKVVEGMNGKIDLTNTARGAALTVRLPRAREV